MTTQSPTAEAETSAADALSDEAADDRDELPAPYLNLPPTHPETEAIWRQRAAAYNSAYPGPIHWRRALNVLAATGSLPLALREANISRGSFNDRRERYPEFAAAVLEANDYFREKTIEQTAVSRAVDGYLVPIYHKGALVGLKRQYSDTIMVKLLEGNLPDKYKQRIDANFNGKVEVVGGLPEMPLTMNDVPAAYKHLEHDPHVTIYMPSPPAQIAPAPQNDAAAPQNDSPTPQADSPAPQQ